MAMQAGSQSVVHKGLIAMMVSYFRQQHYTDMLVNLPGFPKPFKIGRHIPDLTCRQANKEKTFIVLAAGTCDAISNDYTAEQWMAFYEYVNSVGGQFYIAVPTSCGCKSGRALVRFRLRELCISADAIWVPQDKLIRVA
ncbi:MAG: hypothetical protein K6T91_03425 [Firmicutes bacterium]|nr:hypothetical protein [Bacillota bacterium]